MQAHWTRNMALPRLCHSARFSRSRMRGAIANSSSKAISMAARTRPLRDGARAEKSLRDATKQTRPQIRPSQVWALKSLAASVPACAGLGIWMNKIGTTHAPRAVRLPHQRARAKKLSLWRSTISASHVADRDDLEMPDATGRLYLGGIALFLANQCTCDR